ncbi:KpsF/GutQ family sugar-phosphate isomerase [Clostridium sp. OM02-18AC]|uniref:KpsF/GutQ family sugar-phosphate isomerase n=1 Tax=Clostridium sp. OM02-18AC TaxID=2292311 RepID=UPI0015F8C060|nr:KpsF/GutQ family sugar-phosphate isomerase [Clostridium sp. OM02-18AC]
MNVLKEAVRVFDIEIEALQKTKLALDDTFVKIVDLITTCEGKVVVTGMGKSGHVASKISATFSSLGTSSFYMNPAEAMHGDLGMLSAKDIVIIISYSGESEEIVRILPNIKLIGAMIIGITGNASSTLSNAADIVQILPQFEEACYLGLAPTSSTTSVLCYGDALAVVASGIYGFKNADFGKFHPAGSLGKKLVLKVDDLMEKNSENAIVHVSAPLKSAIIELSKKGLGIVSIVGDNNKLLGVITDGDLRRQLELGVDVYSLKVETIMTRTPKTIKTGKLAVEALTLMKKTGISCLPVIDGEKVVGTIRLQRIIGAGIVG